jgi:HAE1 family hydrophobic/amphiphilic exporter-1
MRMNTPVQEMEILRDQASTYGVSAQQIENTLAAAFSQGLAGQIQTPLNVYWVILEVLDRQRARLKDPALLWVRNASNALVPLGSLVRSHVKTGPESISHINQITSVTIFYNLAPGTATGDATTALSKAAQEILPPSVVGSPA